MVTAPENDINNIERVQRRATKLIDGFKNLEYQERPLRLNLPTLAFRRLREDMIEVFKHLHCYDKSTLNDRFVLRVSQRRTTWGRVQLFLHQINQVVEYSSEECPGCTIAANLQGKTFSFRTFHLLWKIKRRNLKTPSAGDCCLV